MFDSFLIGKVHVRRKRNKTIIRERAQLSLKEQEVSWSDLLLFLFFYLFASFNPTCNPSEPLSIPIKVQSSIGFARQFPKLHFIPQPIFSQKTKIVFVQFSLNRSLTYIYVWQFPKNLEKNNHLLSYLAKQNSTCLFFKND